MASTTLTIESNSKWRHCRHMCLVYETVVPCGVFVKERHIETILLTYLLTIGMCCVRIES